MTEAQRFEVCVRYYLYHMYMSWCYAFYRFNKCLSDIAVSFTGESITSEKQLPVSNSCHGRQVFHSELVLSFSTYYFFPVVDS